MVLVRTTQPMTNNPANHKRLTTTLEVDVSREHRIESVDVERLAEKISAVAEQGVGGVPVTGVRGYYTYGYSRCQGEVRTSDDEEE